MKWSQKFVLMACMPTIGACYRHRHDMHDRHGTNDRHGRHDNTVCKDSKEHNIATASTRQLTLPSMSLDYATDYQSWVWSSESEHCLQVATNAKLANTLVTVSRFLHQSKAFPSTLQILCKINGTDLIAGLVRRECLPLESLKQDSKAMKIASKVY